jgi:hypothetical protein
MLGWQEQKADAAGIAGMRQTSFQGSSSGLAACCVSIEAEDHTVGEAHQAAHMVFGAGGAQRGHRVSQARLRECHNVHVAFHHQGIARFADGCARLIQPIEFAALDEDRCLR